MAGGERVYCFKADQYVGNGGFFDGVVWRAHYWVTDGKRIVDLTANQFGAAPIVVTLLMMLGITEISQN